LVQLGTQYKRTKGKIVLAIRYPINFFTFSHYFYLNLVSLALETGQEVATLTATKKVIRFFSYVKNRSV